MNKIYLNRDKSLNILLIFLLTCHIIFKIKKKLNTEYKNINIIYWIYIFPYSKMQF